MKSIRNWTDFQEILNDSETHYLKYNRFNAQLYTKEGGYDGYFSTHTFDFPKESTKRLQDAGFNVKIIGSKKFMSERIEKELTNVIYPRVYLQNTPRKPKKAKINEEEILKEYELIKQKKSKLSRNQRDKIVEYIKESE